MGELIRVVGLETLTPALSKQEKPALAYLCERRHGGNAIEQKRYEVVARGPHACVLMVYDAQTIVLVHDQIKGMIVAMAKNSRTGRQLRCDVIQFNFQLCRFTMTQCFVAQAAKVMIEKEIQLPGELGLVECQPARDRVTLKRPGCGCLNLRDNLDRLLNQSFALFIGSSCENPA